MRATLTLILLFLLCGSGFSQNSVRFKVLDHDGGVLVGASIQINGSLQGEVTDTEGLATFNDLPDGKSVFVVSFVGHENKTVRLVFPGDNGKLIEVELEGGEELEEIVISATRSSRTIEDIPTRIEAITGEELGEKAAMNSTNIGMLLRELTGVQMQQTSLSSGNLSMRIQGLDGRYTQILKDGFPIFGGFAGGLSIMQIPPLDLKQVELIKGSSSTLYGGGAIAGLVNLVTIQPGEEPVFDIMLDQTSAIKTTGNVFYARKFGKTGVSLYGSASNQREFDPDDDGFSNMPNAKTFTLNPRFFLYPNQNTELMLALNMTFDDRQGGDMEVLAGNADANHLFLETNKSNRYATQFSLRNSGDKRSWGVRNSISYFNRELTLTGFEFSGRQLSSFSEFFYQLEGKGNSDWQFGLNHYLEEFREADLSLAPERDYQQSTLGAFVQNTSSLSENIILEGGLRTDYNADYGLFVLPRVSLLFNINPALTARLGGALGYKLPTIFTEDAEKLYFRGIRPLDPNVTDAETSTGGNFDINYKTAIGQNLTFSINQLFFATQLKNALVLREDSNASDYFFEAADGDILSSGFETNVKFTYKDFKLFMNYALINTELRYDNINNQKPLTPRHNAGFVFIYEVHEKWSAGYELYYTGKQFTSDYQEKQDFWTMGFMAMRHFKNITLFINFENFSNVLQSNFEPLVLPPTSNPSFPEIWAPTDGFVMNGGLKIRLMAD